jgi:hypothetical protein
MASGIEQELLEASGFEPRRNLGRQDYLAALARAINEVDETDFDAMSVEAQDWFNDAVRALNKKKNLPDFPDAETETEVAKASKGEKDGTEGDPTPPPSPATIPDPDEDPVEDDEDDDEAEEAEEEKPKPLKTAKAAKAPKVVKAKKVKEPEPEEVEAAAEEEAEEVEEKPKIKRLSDMANQPKDKWGFPIKTKNSAAMSMFEKGCRMADVTEAIGGSYYNALSKAVKRGHQLEKASNGVMRLTCMDEIKPVKAKAKK